jgi:hypothetical protein
MFDCRVIVFARRMLAAATIAGGLLLTLGGSAQAQFFDWWGNPAAASSPQNAMIAPAKIYSIVAWRGYRISGRLQLNGRNYSIDVIDSWNRPLRLVIDAYQGNILQAFILTPTRPVTPVPQRVQSRAGQHPSHRVSAHQLAAASGKSHVVGGVGYKAKHASRRRPVTTTKIATREPTATTAKPSRSHHVLRARLIAARPHPVSGTAAAVPPTRSKVGPAAAASKSARVRHSVRAAAIAPRTRPTTGAAAATPAPFTKVVPATDGPKPLPVADPEPAPAAASGARPPAPSANSPKIDGPGFANGVPINPLD